MSDQSEKPQPSEKTVPLETQAKILSQNLLSKLSELKKAYEPDKINQIQIQLQEIGRQIVTLGPNLVNKELSRLRQVAVEELVARNQQLFNGTRTEILKTTGTPNVDLGNMNWGWEKLSASKAIQQFQEQPLRQAIKKGQEVLGSKFSDFQHNNIQLQMFFLEKTEDIAVARGFITSLSTLPKEK